MDSFGSGYGRTAVKTVMNLLVIHRVLEISWLNKQQPVSNEGLFSMELVDEIKKSKDVAQM